MLTQELLDLIREQLVDRAPWRAGRHEYVAGVNDTVAAARRLAADPHAASREDAAPTIRNTGLVMEYLQLELASLIRLIDTDVGQAGTTIVDNNDVLRARLHDVRRHLDAAMGALTDH